MDPKVLGVGLVAFVCGFGVAIGVSTLSDNSQQTITQLNAKLAAAAQEAAKHQSDAAKLAAQQERQIGQLTAEVKSLAGKADGNVAAQRVAELERELAAQTAAAKDRIETLQAESSARLAQITALNQAASRRPATAEAALAEGGEQEADGFTCYNVQFRGKQVIGEIRNKSGKDSQIATFTLTLYDGDGGLIEVVDVIVPNLKNGKSQPFSSRLDAALPDDGTYAFKLSTTL